jgi:hypothetical protein
MNERLIKTKTTQMITSHILALVLVLVPPVTVDMVQSLQRGPIFLHLPIHPLT